MRRPGEMPQHAGRRKQGIAAVLVIGFVALAVASPSLGHSWFWDDLHFIRAYPTSQLEASLTHQFDPDHVETPAWRPALLLLTDLRYRLLGESPTRQRLLNIAVAALALGTLALAFWRAGIPLWLLVGGAVIELTAQNGAYSLAWNTDSDGPVQGLLFGGALLALLRALKPGRRQRELLALSAALWVLMLLYKEQGVALLPIVFLVPVLTLWLARNRAGQPGSGLVRDWFRMMRARRDVRLYYAGVTLLATVDLVLNRQLAPGGPRIWSLSSAWNGLKQQLQYEVSMSGKSPRLHALVAGLLLVLVIAAPYAWRSALGRTRARVLRVTAIFFAVAAASATSFAIVRSREDLGFLPVFFYGSFLCSAIGLMLLLLWRRPVVRAATAGIVAAAAAWSGYQSLEGSVAIQQAMGTWSVQTLDYDYQALYGEGPRWTIPAQRRAEVAARLRALGITGRLPHDDAYRLLYCLARQATRQKGGVRPYIPTAYVFPSLYPPREQVTCRRA